MTRVKVTHYGWGRELDSFTASDEKIAAEELSNLLRRDWKLSLGDVIKITETKQ